MNPTLYTVGPLTVRAFTAPILLCVVIGAGWLALMAWRRGEPIRRWWDCGLGVLIGAIIGARIVHISLEWPYFSANTGELFSLAGGGLVWHGAALGGIVGGALMTRVRRVPLAAFADACAIFVPLLGVAVWQGCGAAACAYGAEVRTLADFPGWLVLEAPDIYRSIAPRLNLPLIGSLWSVVIFLIILTLSRLNLARAVRLWVSLVALSLGLFFIGFVRADYVPIWLGRRADQVLDLAIFLIAAGVWITLKLAERRAVRLNQSAQGV